MQQIESQEDFETQKGSAPIVVFDFSATWCGPCRMLSPILESLETRYPEDQVRFFKVDVDANGPVANKFRVSAVPTVIFFFNEKLVGQPLVGVRQENEYVKIIDGLLDELPAADSAGIEMPEEEYFRPEDEESPSSDADESESDM
jgi:thioredoxin 1